MIFKFTFDLAVSTKKSTWFMIIQTPSCRLIICILLFSVARVPNFAPFAAEAHLICHCERHEFKNIPPANDTDGLEMCPYDDCKKSSKSAKIVPVFPIAQQV